VTEDATRATRRGLSAFAGLILLSARGALAAEVVNDVTGLNPVPVARIVVPHSVAEVSRLVREHEGPIGIGGARHSQGGQIAADGCLFLDMRAMNHVLVFDPQARRRQRLDPKCKFRNRLWERYDTAPACAAATGR
jgi:FAD/FMN-containing dehydrogenase